MEIVVVPKMLLDDLSLKMGELADKVGIPKSAVHCIFTEYLDMRKLCAKCLSHLLTIKQKLHCENVSVGCLVMFSQQ